MKNYTDFIEKIIKTGVKKEDRTGVGTISIFGDMLKFDISKNFPLLTARKIALRIAFEETMFFLRGETDTKKLEEKKINIWKGNTSREFLDSRGLTHLPVGDMGKGYGYQWARWENYTIKSYKDFIEHEDGSVTFIDAKILKEHVNQIKNLLNDMKNNPNSRRHLVTAWNPGQLDEMALPPCHLLHQYNIEDGKLNSLFFMRSNDCMYGLPYNIAGYALLNYIFSKYLGLTPGELTYMVGDAHIYLNQLDIANELINRTIPDLPTLKIIKELNTFEDIENLQFDDLFLENYNPNSDFQNKPPMAT